MNEFNWKSVCLNAVDAAKDLPLQFATEYQDMKANKGPCKLVGAIIEPSEEYDEESLPVYLVKLESGTRIEALEEELSSQDADGLKRLIEGVSMTFGIARVLGDWAWPSHLMEEADETTKRRFVELLQSTPSQIAGILNEPRPCYFDSSASRPA